MCQINIRKIIFLISIAVLNMVFITGCEQTVNPNENVRFESEPQGRAEDAQKIWGAANGDDKNPLTEDDEFQDMPKIKIISDYGVEVQISNEEEYRGFISRLEEFTDYHMLWVDLGATDTTVYLDEILTYNNFEFLQIKNGGSISFKNTQILNYTIHTIELSHIFSLEKGLLNHIIFGESLVQYNLVIELDNRYSGKLPIEELLNYNDCMNIILVWDDNTEGGALLDIQENMESLKEWDYLQSVQETEGGSLKGIYKLNDGDYSYTSYEFYNHYEESVPEVCAAFISIKDRESKGKEYFDIIAIPINKFSDTCVLHRGTKQRLTVNDDLNFDGYNDLIFNSDNYDISPYHGFITFLWNEKEQRFILDESVPDFINYVDTERKRLTYSSGYALEEDYYIYEYRNNVFSEKHLAINFSFSMEGEPVIWQYFDNGKLIAQLELFTGEDGLYYVLYEEIGGIREEKQVDSGLYNVVGKMYFPEFDFYRVG